jgi:RNA polymerase sigma-70 factor (ECF subfamily)
MRESSAIRTSFDEVFLAEFDSLHNYLARRLGISAADELAAETFATAYRRWADFDWSRPIRPWLYGIAANLVKHRWRRERRMLRAYARTGVDLAFGEDEEAADRLDARSNKAALAAALGGLRRADREVLLLHAWADLSDSEIAEALALPLGTVKSRFSRARKEMRNRIARSGKVEDDNLVALGRYDHE